MAASVRPRTQPQRRRRKQSLGNDKPDIEDDALMASAIGDINWLQQSMWRQPKPQKQGLSAIHLAALNGQLDSLKILVEKFKVDVNLSSSEGWTPLLLAINAATEKKALKCLQYLLESGADITRCNYDNSSAVHQVATKGYVRCLEVLIKAGASIEGVDKDGNTPMNLTRIWGHRHCARILAKYQWMLDKERELLQKLEDDKKAKQVAEEEERLKHEQRIQGQHEGQVAFKNWLSVKHIPDIPTMYGPIPREDRKGIEELRDTKSMPNIPLSKTESTFVIKSKSEIGPLHPPRKAKVEIDEDKRLDLIPLDTISASKRRQIQRMEQMKLNRMKQGAKSVSPMPSR